KVYVVSTEVSGVLGFLRSTDGRLLAYGGLSHMGMHTGYITQVNKEHLQYAGQFESNDSKQPIPDKVSEIRPRGPIDLMANDFDKGGFWVVSAHILYRTNSQLSAWTKVVDLGGRWYGGRRFSVGNTPT